MRQDRDVHIIHTEISVVRDISSLTKGKEGW